MNGRIIFVIVIIAVTLRLINLNQSLWLDEGINAIFAQKLTYKDLIFKYPLGDFHPPLYHLVLKFITSIVGNSEIALRVPSVIFGVLTIVVTYLIAKKLYDVKTALTAAILIATSPLHVYYSQEARMYMMAAFFSTLSLYFFVCALKESKLLHWIGFITATTIVLYTDYMPYFLIPSYLIYVIIFRKKLRKNTLNAFLPALLLIALLISPWLLIIPGQLNTGISAAQASPAWAQVVGGSTPKDLALVFVKFAIGRISNDNNFLYFLTVMPIIVYIFILILLSLMRLSAKRAVLYFQFLTPIFVAFTFSFVIPIFSYFRFIFALPAFYIILASAIANLSWTVPTRIMLGVMLFVNIVSTTIYFINPKFQREDWKSATKYVQEAKSNTSIVLFESNFTMSPFDYYNRGKIEAKGALDSFNPNPQKVSENVESLTYGKDKIFLFQYLSAITDPQGFLYQSLVENGFTNTKTKDFNGVGFVYEFTK